MTVVVRPARVDGRLPAPPSKSHTHRAYVLAALSGNGLVTSSLESDDTQATLEGLRGLGFLATREAAGVRVGGTLRPGKAPLQTRNSGTTLRLLSCVAALQGKPVALDAAPGLRERPMAPLLQALEQLGAQTQSAHGHAPLSVHGPLKGGTCDLPGNVSSQFVSGLLLAVPLARTDTTIRLTSPLVSRPYVDMTLACLRHHGVKAAEHGKEFLVPAEQRIRQKPYTVPGDYSSAAFLFAAAAVSGGRVTLTNLPPDDTQGDRAILEHLAAFGCNVIRDGDTATVQDGRLEGHVVAVGETPDLFPPLCAVAAVAHGKTDLVGAPHLRLKESNRIQALRTNLEHFGIRCEELPDGLRVHGGQPKGTRIESFGDHRVAMAGLVLGLAAQGQTALDDPAVLNKSYPNFVDDLRRLTPEVKLA